jgi:hypothetical protein
VIALCGAQQAVLERVEHFLGEYRSMASAYRAQAKAGISQTSLLTNISRTFNGLASQLEILEADVAAEQRKAR